MLLDELEKERAHADQMTALAEMWARKEREARQTIIALVHSSGGEIIVSGNCIHDLPDLELVVDERPYDLTFRFRTRPKLAKAGAMQRGY